MQLTAIDRLCVFLEIHHPDIHYSRLSLSQEPGFMIYKKGGLTIDITGVGYDPARGGKYKLWRELHQHYNAHVEILKKKNGTPTKISWQGKVYDLNRRDTFTNKKST